jgi:hypothetical protein
LLQEGPTNSHAPDSIPSGGWLRDARLAIVVVTLILIAAVVWVILNGAGPNHASPGGI